MNSLTAFAGRLGGKRRNRYLAESGYGSCFLKFVLFASAIVNTLFRMRTVRPIISLAEFSLSLNSQTLEEPKLAKLSMFLAASTPIEVQMDE